MKLLSQWDWSGTHYEKTANAWLENLDKNKTCIAHPKGNLWRKGWRNVASKMAYLFYGLCRIMGIQEGVEWRVGHYLFQK
jgi:cyclopropane-fatty-acyl-phospholipid synthase